MNSQKGKINIGSIIIILILLILAVISFNIYRYHNFNGFEKAVGIDEGVKFSRDSKVKYSKTSSYKIENLEFNDSTMYKEVEVERDTPYRITCMVKTENIVNEDANAIGGATIGLLETVQYSKPITGTKDWQKVEYIFNSKNMDKVQISFRLGGNETNSKGTVWFSDFKLEKGTKNTNSEWNMVCFLLNEIDVNIDGKQYNLKLNTTDKENVRLNMERFKNDCYQFSKNKMTVNYDIYEINEPVTNLSYSKEHGYHVGPENVVDLVYDIVKEHEYDHIFVVARMENDDGTSSIPILDNWIGLGSMDMFGIGYSNIRINNNSNKYTYKYGITNQMPEEVYLHEFLHTLERNNNESGYTTISLHNYEQYGYTNKNVDGLNQWYKDYMQKNIYDRLTSSYVGLDDFCYTTQPFNSDNFKYPLEKELYREPQNIIEEIQSVINILFKNK